MSLFNFGQYELHSGQQSSFLIDCDALSDSDLDALATIAVQMVDPFFLAIGVPLGGLRFANALERYVDVTATHLLIVDDVLTTGNSMEEARREAECKVDPSYLKSYPDFVQGVVIFDRCGRRYPWCQAIFTMDLPTLA